MFAKRNRGQISRVEENFGIESPAQCSNWWQETWCRGAVVIRTGAVSRSHSRESGNPLRRPRGIGYRILDSRFRGNDWRFEGDPNPNDTDTTPAVTADQSEDNYVSDDI
jgi:hypothetical protein